ncbi:hypothetical protein D9M71_195770 [compost metagenome]
MTGTQAFDLRLHVAGQARIGLHHVGPHGVATDGRALHAAQHSTQRRRLAPGGIGVPGILVAVDRTVRALVDLHQPRVLRIAADNRMVLQLAEAASEGHMFGTGDVLVAQKHHTVLDQLGTNLGEQAIVVDGIGQVNADQLCANGAGKLLDLHGTDLLR